MTNNSSRKIDPTIIAALIGVCGTITVTLITLFASNLNRQPTLPSPTALVAFTETATATLTATAVPTDTVPPGEPTSTPAPATDTPLPTFTPIPPVPLGQDWGIGCISSLWVVYPPTQTSTENGCLVPPVDKFYVSSGKLAFTYAESVASAEVHGLFAKLPTSGRLSLNMDLDEVSNGEIWVGVLGAPDVNSNGAMLVIPEGNNLDNTKMFLKAMPGQRLFSQSSKPIESNSGVYDLFFEFDSGEVSVRVQNGQVELGTISALSAERWLFIGYQAFNGPNRLKAEFFNLVIVQ